MMRRVEAVSTKAQLPALPLARMVMENIGHTQPHKRFLSKEQTERSSGWAVQEMDEVPMDYRTPILGEFLSKEISLEKKCPL